MSLKWKRAYKMANVPTTKPIAHGIGPNNVKVYPVLITYMVAPATTDIVKANV